MKIRHILASFIAIMLAVSLSFPVMAARPDPLELVTDWKSVYCAIKSQTTYLYGLSEDEQDAYPCPDQNIVNNPTLNTGASCVWDVDDAWSMFDRSGTIEIGQIVTASMCAIADGTHRPPIDAVVRAKHPHLSVRLDASDGRSWVAIPVRDGNEYEYVACGENFMKNAWLHPDFPDSNGGWGTSVIYTLTIDATKRGANGVLALLDYGVGIWGVGSCH